MEKSGKYRKTAETRSGQGIAQTNQDLAAKKLREKVGIMLRKEDEQLSKTQAYTPTYGAAAL